MNIQSINSEKINLINWITNLQDSSMLAKIKELYLSSEEVIPQWQQDIVLERIKNTPREDYVSWDEIEKNIKFD